MDKNCPISKGIYQFLLGACVKMRAILKLYSLIGNHTSNVFLEPRLVHRQQIRTARVSGCHLSSTLEFIKRYKCPKAFNVRSSKTFFVFHPKLLCTSAHCSQQNHLCFFTCSIKRWDQESHGPKVLLYIQGVSESWFAFLTLEDQETLLPCHPQKGKNTFSSENKDASSLKCFIEAIAK